LLYIIVFIKRGSVEGWQRWNYMANATVEWQKLYGLKKGPGARRGHAMTLFGSKIILFAGRSNEILKSHVPRSYQVRSVNGSMKFMTYDDAPVDESICASRSEMKNQTNETVGCSNTIPVGLYFNDVWEYELNCTRYGDEACIKNGWIVRNPGAFRGGCRVVMGRELCTHPYERWHSGVAMFNDSTMLIYGGFSQRCEDYCDDLWSFDLRDNTWMEIYPISKSGENNDRGGPGKRWKFSLVGDGESLYIFGGFRLWHGYADDNSLKNRWSSNALMPKGGYMNDFWKYKKRLLDPFEPVPTISNDIGNWTKLQPQTICSIISGDTWAERDATHCSADWPSERAGHVAALDTYSQGIWLFGGYRTYFPYIATDGPGVDIGVVAATSGGSGFTPYPDYGYFLNDLWFYNLTSGFWTQVFDGGSSQENSQGSNYPVPRSDLSMILSGHILIFFGGFNASHHFDDTWYFNVTSKYWLKKNVAIYPLWPWNCTDDLNTLDSTCFLLDWPKPIKPHCNALENEGCPNFDWYEPDPNNTEVLADGTYFALPFYGIIDKSEPIPTLPATGYPIVPYAATGPLQYVSGPTWWNETWLHQHKYVDGDLFTFFVDSSFSNQNNQTIFSGTYYIRCTSVKGEPTRFSIIDGLYGRSSSPVLIPQPRRRAPGWDGCRDKCFGIATNELSFTTTTTAFNNHDDDKLQNTENQILFKQELSCPDSAILYEEEGLQYFHPNQRSAHAIVYAENLGQQSHEPGEIYIFGGLGYISEVIQATDLTQPVQVLDDMWRLGIHDCPNNCSMQGDCYYGYCRCYHGYYGSDCSNISCPGDFCYYDENTNEQKCQHCCQAAFNHSDDDVYILDIPKLPCSFSTQRLDGSFGESNGICDGFGTCQCSPPYIGDDCSIKDCPQNCSHRGYCSIEFPVSRCLCHPGYYGDYCQYIHCLNNCSYPNGHCNHTTGLCTCEMMYSPYNNSREYHAWEGDDCSFLWAYCGSCQLKRPSFFIFLFLFLFFLFSFRPPSHFHHHKGNEVILYSIGREKERQQRQRR